MRVETRLPASDGGPFGRDVDDFAEGALPEVREEVLHCQERALYNRPRELETRYEPHAVVVKPYHSHDTVLVDHILRTRLQPRLRLHPNAAAVDQYIQRLIFSEGFGGGCDAVFVQVVEVDDGGACRFELVQSASILQLCA